MLYAAKRKVDRHPAHSYVCKHDSPTACRGPKGRSSESPDGLMHVGMRMSRTFVYIDGFNLYYRAVRGTPHKWLDIAALSAASLPSTCVIQRVNYYTAHISGRLDPSAPARQHAYLRALATLPGVAIHYGKFMVTQK